MKTVSKSSFTLFELLVVIFIISIIYTIFVERLPSKERILRTEGVGAIAKTLQDYDFNESASFLCTDRCKHCFVYLDGKEIKEIDSPFKSEPKVYDFDIHGILSQLKFTPIFDKNGNPKDVCFLYTIYSNRSASSYIVEYEKSFYLFYAYLHPPKKVATLQEAAELFDPSLWVPTDSGAYNF